MIKKTPKKKTQVYAFIDTNIYLDFYRANNEASISLFEKLKKVKHRIISTYQVEMEFLKNRQSAILDSLSKIKFTDSVILPAVLSSDTLLNSLKKYKIQGEKKKKNIDKKVIYLLRNPQKNDKIFQVLNDIFTSPSDHVLTRDMLIKRQIKRLAWRRFILGYPPRKGRDNSTGDALNWEWIIHCAKKNPGKMVILSKDSDYGNSLGNEFFLNDQLKREFRDRVGPKKTIIFTQKLSQALKELDIHVTPEEEEAEQDQIIRGRVEGWMTLSDPMESLKRELEDSNLVNIFSSIQPSLESCFASMELMKLNDSFKKLSELGKTLVGQMKDLQDAGRGGSRTRSNNQRQSGKLDDIK